MQYKFPIKTVSEANNREHWRTRNKRKKAQQAEFTAIWRQHKIKVDLPATVIFTRFSCATMDSDNLAGAFKGLRDALAAQVGVDDGSPLYRWEYRQERINRREHYFTVEIVPKTSITT